MGMFRCQQKCSKGGHPGATMMQPQSQQGHAPACSFVLSAVPYSQCARAYIRGRPCLASSPTATDICDRSQLPPADDRCLPLLKSLHHPAKGGSLPSRRPTPVHQAPYALTHLAMHHTEKDVQRETGTHATHFNAALLASFPERCLSGGTPADVNAANACPSPHPSTPHGAALLLRASY